MKVVILCGGTGNRIAQETKKIPKPMIKIGGQQILRRIMENYMKYGYDDFILACGYKHQIIKKYFKNQKKFKNLKIINTGKTTLTGKRLFEIKKFLIKEKHFMLTYGDGVSNLNFNKLLKFHYKNKKIATVTAVNPVSTFGELKIKKNLIKIFNEKKTNNKIWINGGFFIFSKKVFKYLSSKDSMLEDQLINNLVKNKELAAYKYKGFWKCLDNYKDKIELENIFNKRNFKL